MYNAKKPNRIQRFFGWLASIRWMTAWLSKLVGRADNLLLRLTNNRRTVSQILTGLPTVIITTKGAKSGLPRTLPLAAFPDGGRYYLIASNFGGARHPAWYYNLRANPLTVLTTGAGAKSYTAREAEGEEWERAWTLACQYYVGYEKYRRRAAHRQIPIIILEPVDIGLV
jgi:deazaflavin-dependent oxidoreductase (nitroreductase family)